MAKDKQEYPQLCERKGCLNTATEMVGESHFCKKCADARAQRLLRAIFNKEH